MNKLFTLLGLLFLFGSSKAQSTFQCGVNHSNDSITKDRMLANRAAIPHNVIESAKASRANYYIPIQIHMIGEDDGTGYADIDEVFGSVCQLNEDYTQFGVQFYIDLPIRFVNNSTIYNNSHNQDAYPIFGNLTVNNKMNIFVGPSVDSPVSSYYLNGYDYVFLLDQMMGYGEYTLTHEVGHFFTLPHTFYGWEDMDARDYAGQSIPSNINWARAESVRRSGGNCNSAADGFCGTEADYVSFRAPCPMTYDLRDRYGESLDPDETNIMSYYYDECVSTFSDDQENAIIADIFSRGWSNFSAPNLNTVDPYVLSNPSPTASESVEHGSNLTISWDAVDGASNYLLTIDRSHHIVDVSLENIETVVTTNPNYTISTSNLELDTYYRWSVIPFTESYTCADVSEYSKFVVEAKTTGINDEFNELGIYPNPTNGILNIDLEGDKNIEVYSMEGKLLTSEWTNGLQFDVSSFTAGIYLIKVSHQDKVYTSRIIKE